jgi:hypothetical protein
MNLSSSDANGGFWVTHHGPMDRSVLRFAKKKITFVVSFLMRLGRCSP